MMILCFILFDIITNGTSSSKSDSNDQEISSSSSSSSSTTAVGDAYTLLNKIKTSCEMNSMVVGSKLIDYYNSYDEHTDRYIRMTNDYFMRQLGFAYWLQSSYMYNHLLSSSSPSMQHPHYNVKDRFHEITAIQKQNGWNYEYMTLLVTSDHEGNHHHHHGAESSSNDGDIAIASSSASSTYETSISTSIPPADTATVTTTSTSTEALEKTVGYQYNSLRDKWIYFLGDSTLHQLFHTFLRVDHGM